MAIMKKHKVEVTVTSVLPTNVEQDIVRKVGV